MSKKRQDGGRSWWDTPPSKGGKETIQSFCDVLHQYISLTPVIPSSPMWRSNHCISPLALWGRKHNAYFLVDHTRFQGSGGFWEFSSDLFSEWQGVYESGIGPRVGKGFAACTSRQPCRWSETTLQTLNYLLVGRDDLCILQQVPTGASWTRTLILQQHCAICGRKWHTRVILIQAFSWDCSQPATWTSSHIKIWLGLENSPQKLIRMVVSKPQFLVGDSNESFCSLPRGCLHRFVWVPSRHSSFLPPEQVGLIQKSINSGQKPQSFCTHTTVAFHGCSYIPFIKVTYYGQPTFKGRQLQEQKYQKEWGVPEGYLTGCGDCYNAL